MARVGNLWPLIQSDTLFATGAGGLFMRHLMSLFVLLLAPALAAEPLQVPHSTLKPVLDGRLDDPVWQQALRLSLDWEVKATDSRPAQVETDFWMVEDGTHLYLAFDARDPDMSRVIAHLHDRDEFWEDDFVGVLLDTFNDERRAYQFFVNPLGVQADATLDDTSRQKDDASWNALWDSAAHMDEHGYRVEMAIPLSSINLPPATGKPMIWGIEAIRYWPREQVFRFSTLKNDRNRNCQVCQFTKVAGFAHRKHGLDLEVTPTVTVAQRRSRAELDAPARTDKPDGEMGLDVNWGIRPNLTLNATLNPDFSQIEADAVQADANNRFALFYPEKRPFFLENADFFNFPGRIVYTRTVTDPDVGLRLTGKSDGHQYGLMVSNDTVTSLFVPQTESSSLERMDTGSLNVAARYRYEATEDLTLGLIGTWRSAEDYYNGLLGADLRWNLADRHRLQARYLYSGSEYPLELRQAYGLDERQAGSRRQVVYNYSSRNLWGYLGYTLVDPEFRADMGFLRRVNLNRMGQGVGYRWINDQAGAWWSQFELAVRGFQARQLENGALLERQRRLSLEFNGFWQSEAAVSVARQTTVYQGRRFPRQYWEGRWSMRPRPWLRLELRGRHGDDVDYTHVRPATLRQLRPAMSLNVGTRLQLDFNHLRQDLDVAGGRLYRLDLGELRARWQFSTRSWLRLISQYRLLQRDPALYVSEVGRESRRLSNQLLFAYRLDAKSVLYAGYSDQGLGDEYNPGRTLTDQTLFVKFGYTWQGG